LNGKFLAGPQNHHQTTLQGQGGRVEKANDPQPEQVLTRPRCGHGRSGEAVNDPEGPVNFTEGHQHRKVEVSDMRSTL
jgi:hypothetical protein